VSLLRTIIEEMEKDGKDNLQKIRELCDQISKEEAENITHETHLPKGPNIILSLEVPGRNTKEIAYLTLEREGPALYLAVLYTIPLLQIRMPDSSLKRQKVWTIEEERPEKILTEYAKKYKFLRGE